MGMQSLVVQRLAGVGDEHRGDAEGVVLDEDRGGGVPGGVAAGFEGRPEAAAGERRRVRLLLGKHLAVKGFDYAALAVIVDQGVVLFRRAFGQGLEPVRDMRHVMLQGPFLHAILLHLVPVEGQFAEILGRPPLGSVHGPCLLHEGFPHQVESVHILQFVLWFSNKRGPAPEGPVPILKNVVPVPYRSIGIQKPAGPAGPVRAAAGNHGKTSFLSLSRRKIRRKSFSDKKKILKSSPATVVPHPAPFAPFPKVC